MLNTQYIPVWEFLCITVPCKSIATRKINSLLSCISLYVSTALAALGSKRPFPCTLLYIYLAFIHVLYIILTLYWNAQKNIIALSPQQDLEFLEVERPWLIQVIHLCKIPTPWPVPGCSFCHSRSFSCSSALIPLPLLFSASEGTQNSDLHIQKHIGPSLNLPERAGSLRGSLGL